MRNKLFTLLFVVILVLAIIAGGVYFAIIVAEPKEATFDVTPNGMQGISKEDAEKAALQYFIDLQSRIEAKYQTKYPEMKRTIIDTYKEAGFWKVKLIINQEGAVINSLLIPPIQNQVTYFAINASTGELKYTATEEGEQAKRKEQGLQLNNR